MSGQAMRSRERLSRGSWGRALLARGDSVVALSRNARSAQERLGPNVDVREWAEPEGWAGGGRWRMCLARGCSATNGDWGAGALTGRVFSFIGLISYGIYILHEPIGWLLHAGLESLDWFPEHPNGWLWGIGFLVLLTGLAWQADRRYDGPVRRALNARFMAKRE